MFSNIINSTGIHPIVIITDADPAINVAVHQVFSSTYPIHYAYHIFQNLHKNLSKELDNEYKDFLKAFYSCQNCIIEEIFQQHFEKIQQNYPKVKNYLEFLYKTKTY